MPGLDFCLRAQSLQNNSEEVFWDGNVFLSPISENAQEYLKKSDFVYLNGVTWFVFSNLKIKLHLNGWVMLEIIAIERDDSSRIAPVIVVANFKRLKVREVQNIFSRIPVIIGRNFAPQVLELASDQVEKLIIRQSSFLVLLTLTKYILIKFFKGKK